jgi:hypothetical protein
LYWPIASADADNLDTFPNARIAQLMFETGFNGRPVLAHNHFAKQQGSTSAERDSANTVIGRAINQVYLGFINN